MLDICDKYAVAMLHTVLGPTGGVIFCTLYDEYTKYYKYTGRV